MSDPTTDDAAVSVEDGGIRVSKSFSNDEFPVPAVVFDLISERDDPIRLRIVDTIPESFPMDRVGFHPDYESDAWTAYNDHRVEFERVLDPGETLTTVYGIRDDDPDVDAFLGVPTVETAPEGEEMDEVLGADGAEVVRDVLGGERSSLPGMDEPDQVTEGDDLAESVGPSQDAVAAAADPEDVVDPLDGVDDPESDASEESATPEVGVDELQSAEPQSEESQSDESQSVAPRSVPTDATAAVTSHDDRAEASQTVVSEEPEEPVVAEKARTEASETGDDGDVPDDGPDDESAVTPDESDGARTSDSGSVAAALAAEIRSGEVDEADLDLLQEELDLGTPNSVDVRISRLQSRLGDLSAYVEALQTFIDEEGTADGVLAEIEDEIGELDDAVGELTARAERADSEREGLADDLADVEEFVENVRQEVSAVGDDLEETDDRVDDVEAHTETIDEELGDVWDDIAEMDARLVDVEETIEETTGESDVSLAELEGEIARIDEELAELEGFRERLSDAFGA